MIEYEGRTALDNFLQEAHNYSYSNQYKPKVAIVHYILFAQLQKEAILDLGMQPLYTDFKIYGIKLIPTDIIDNGLIEFY